MYTQKGGAKGEKKTPHQTPSQIIGATRASPLLQQPGERHSLWKTIVF